MKLMKVIAAGLLVMIAAGVILTACECCKGETGRRPVGTEKSRRYGRKEASVSPAFNVSNFRSFPWFWNLRSTFSECAPPDPAGC